MIRIIQMGKWQEKHLEERVTSLETTVAQYQLENSKQLLKDVASDVKKNPSFKKLIGG